MRHRARRRVERKSATPAGIVKFPAFSTPNTAPLDVPHVDTNPSITISHKRKIKTERGFPSRSSSSSTVTRERGRSHKKFRTTLSELSEMVICPISHELMVDPVLAADGKTYERAEIEQWLETHGTSPITNQRLATKTLFENHAVKQQIEKLVESGELDSRVRAEWLERKCTQSPEYPQDLFDEGNVERARDAPAQELVARRRHHGSDGVTRKSEIWLCPISQEIMVDPVIAADGMTYERKEIERWLETYDTSPVTDQRLKHRILIENHAVKQQIEKMVQSGRLRSDVRWQERKRNHVNIPKHARELFEEGKVEEAAKLGHAEAQGLMAGRCYFGSHGEMQDAVKAVAWAKEAAAGGDMVGQHYLGRAYEYGEGGLAKNWALAKDWYEKAASQGDSVSMNNLGVMYQQGGHGMSQNHVTAFEWYHKAAEAGNYAAQHGVGQCYYYGRGVAQDLVQARIWLQKSADQNYAYGQCMLATMMVRGEGGDREFSNGIALWEKAAAQGFAAAQMNLQKMNAALGGVGFALM